MTDSYPPQESSVTSSVERQREKLRLNIEQQLAIAMGKQALDSFREFVQNADDRQRVAAFAHLASLLSLMTGQRIESEPSYEPDENLPRLHQFINILCQKDFSEAAHIDPFSRHDLSGVVNALIILDTHRDVRTDVADMANVLGLAFQGLTDREIALMRSTTRTAISQRLAKIRDRIEAASKDKSSEHIENVFMLQVDNARANKGKIWTEDEIPTVKKDDVTAQRPLYGKIKTPRNIMPGPRSTRSKRRQSSDQVAASNDVYVTKNYQSKNLLPDDDCPSFESMWDDKKLERFYLAFYDSERGSEYADIIRARADGTDNTRRPEKDTFQAMARLNRLIQRKDVDFGNDLLAKTALEMLVAMDGVRLNTLGDIYRMLSKEDPGIKPKDIARIVMNSVMRIVDAR